MYAIRSYYDGTNINTYYDWEKIVSVRTLGPAD